MSQEKTRRTFIQDCSTSAAALVALSATQPVAGADSEGTRGYALSLHHVRDAVRRVGPAARALSDLRGRAAVRQPRRPEVDDARGPSIVAQERHQAGRARPLLGQHRAEVRDRPARVPDPDRRRETSSGIASGWWTTRRSRGSTSWAGSPRSRSRTRTITRRWWSGAAPSATPRSTCMRPSGPG